jgi:dimethylhistidine N-methyltransferase
MPALRDFHPDKDGLLQDLLAGLSNADKSIPPKFLYDARGSELFDEICELEEYYLTRTEVAILERHANEMADLLGENCLLIEYGSGSGLKTRLLLDRLRAPCAYVPIEISREALERSAVSLSERYPDLAVLPVCADYTGHYEIPHMPHPAARRVVYFPGSTIGNFTPPEATEFLERAGEHFGRDGGLLIGVDLEKEPEVLEPAYDDPEGISAAFALNVLTRINRELGADFREDRFEYEAIYNQKFSRIEMSIVSCDDQRVRIDGTIIELARGERIRTEYSYKYSLESFAELAHDAGLVVRRVWTDPRRLFSVQYLEYAAV